MTDYGNLLFHKLTSDRMESASMLEKRSMRGLKMSVVEKYSDQAHFIYELIQNADDVGATEVRFVLLENELVFVHNGTRRFTVSDVETEDAPDSISLQSLDYIYNLSGNAATRLIQFLGIKDEHPEYEELDDDLRTKLERYDRFVKLGLDKFPEDDIAEVLSLLNERKAALGEENDEAKLVKESKETEIINDLKKRIETKPTGQEEMVVSQNEADVAPALPAPDDDLITKAAVNYFEKIEKAKKQFEKEIDVLARMEEAHEKAENCERYSYGWFSAYRTW